MATNTKTNTTTTDRRTHQWAGASLRQAGVVALIGIAMSAAGIGGAVYATTLHDAAGQPTTTTTPAESGAFGTEGAFDDGYVDGGDGSTVDGATDPGSYADSGSYDTGDASYDSGGYDTSGGGDTYGDSSYDTDAVDGGDTYGADGYDDTDMTGSDDSVTTGGDEFIDDGGRADGGDSDNGAAAVDEPTYEDTTPIEIEPTTTTGAPAPKAPAPTTASASTNRPPTLPARTLDVRIPVGERTVLFGDTSLAAGWDDPDHTADWLCLRFTAERRDWWLDGADCTGKGLTAKADVAGTYVVRIRAQEATGEQPGGNGVVSNEEIVLRVIVG